MTVFAERNNWRGEISIRIWVKQGSVGEYEKEGEKSEMIEGDIGTSLIYKGENTISMLVLTLIIMAVFIVVLLVIIICLVRRVRRS